VSKGFSLSTRITCFSVFEQWVLAVLAGELIESVSAKDKEFHFQNWFQKRLRKLGVHFESSGRNTYLDFRLVEFTEGYGVMGLAWPGRGCASHPLRAELRAASPKSAAKDSIGLDAILVCRKPCRPAVRTHDVQAIAWKTLALARRPAAGRMAISGADYFVIAASQTLI
jgi:hypothetical protein